MAIKVRNVGHVVLKVRDLERSARFYRDVLGLKEVARGNFGRPMAFFSTGDNHHDVAVMEVGATAPRPARPAGRPSTRSARSRSPSLTPTSSSTTPTRTSRSTGAPRPSMS